MKQINEFFFFSSVPLHLNPLTSPSPAHCNTAPPFQGCAQFGEEITQNPSLYLKKKNKKKENDQKYSAQTRDQASLRSFHVQLNHQLLFFPANGTQLCFGRSKDATKPFSETYFYYFVCVFEDDKINVFFIVITSKLNYRLIFIKQISRLKTKKKRSYFNRKKISDKRQLSLIIDFKQIFSFMK